LFGEVINKEYLPIIMPRQQPLKSLNCNTRSDYGQKLLEQLSQKLHEQYGKGFSITNLKYFRSFYLAYPHRLVPMGHPAGDEFKSAPTGHPMETGNGFHPDLSWSHYRALMRVENETARQFYCCG
jgi:hypothetical protein